MSKKPEILVDLKELLSLLERRLNYMISQREGLGIIKISEPFVEIMKDEIKGFKEKYPGV